MSENVVEQNTPAGGDTSAPTSEPTISAQSAVPEATPQAPVAAPTPQSQPEPSWLRGRLQETREAAIRQANEQFARERTQMQSQYEAVQRQLHAIVGVTPQEDPEVSAVRNQFQKLYPGLSQLEQRAQDILNTIEQSGSIETQTRHYWGDYGRRTMDGLYDLANKSLGGNLSEEGKRALHASFSGYVASSPELVERYMTDPTLVQEFWQQFEKSFIGPVRRTSAANVQTQTQNRNLPQDTPSGAPQIGGNQGPRPKDLDERAAMAWASFNANRSQGG
jgi:hypothetical protein